MNKNNDRTHNLGRGVFPRAVCGCMDNSEDNLVFAITKGRLIWVNEMGWWIVVHLIMLLFLNAFWVGVMLVIYLPRTIDPPFACNKCAAIIEKSQLRD